MLKKLLAACLIAAAAAGCGGVTTPTPMPLTSTSVSYPADRVVLQLSYGGGLVLIDRVSDLVPDVTLWGDGRAVFVAPDGSIREGQLSPSAVGRLLQSATFLYDLQDHYAAVQHTDAPGATFAIFTEQGGKRVFVYGLDPVLQQEDEPEPAIFARLRALWAEVQAALPAEAPEMAPASVCIQTLYSNRPATAEWPAELTGCLTGDQAREAVSLAGLGEGKSFTVGDRTALVLAVPQIPEPGEPERPENGSSEPQGPLGGSAEDDVLSIQAVADRGHDGQIKVAVTVTNKTDQAVDLLFDCGSLFSWVGLKQPGRSAEMTCPAVYSQLLAAKATERRELSLDPNDVADWSKLALHLRYELAGEQGSGVRALQVHLDSVGE